MSEADGPPSYPTPAQAVEAGLYYFAREDYPAARKWWEYALAIDPHNVRAHECLRILGRTLGEPVESMDVRRVTSADLAPRSASADIPVEAAVEDDAGPDDEPTEALAKSPLRGSPAEAWSRPASSARPQPTPIAPASAWSEGLEPVDSRRPRGPDPPSSGVVDAWSRPASSARAAPEARPAGGAADTWSRPSRPSEIPAPRPAPGQAAETWTRPARPSQAPAPHVEPASAVSVWSRPIAPAPKDRAEERRADERRVDERRPDAVTEQVSARRPVVGPPEVQEAPAPSRTGALPPLPPGAKPLPVGAASARPSPAPVNSLPIASGDLGRYPSMPHRPPAPAEDAARPSVLRFDPLGFEGTASWGAPTPEASSLDRWSRPSGPAISELPAAPAEGLGGWDPGEQARIDGGDDPQVDVGWEVAVQQLAALGGPTDRADILPPVDTFPLTADLVARGAGPEEISAARALRAAGRGAPLPVPPLAEPSSRPGASSGRPAIDVTDRRVEAVPTPKGGIPRLGPAPSTGDLRRATAMAGIPTADLRRTVGQRTADVAAPASFDPFGPPSEAPAPRGAAPTPPPSDPFGALLEPAASAPTARDAAHDPRPPSGDLRPREVRPPSGDLRPPSGDLRPPSGELRAPRIPDLRASELRADPRSEVRADPRATFDPFAPPSPAPGVTWGAGAARPPSVFSSATPLPEPRTFSVDLDERSGAPVVTAEELMGDPAPPPRPESGDFDVIVEEPEEAPASPPTALEFALSAFESASEPDIIAVAPRPSSPTLQPWDDGPAETSHVTISQDQHESDAVAELTPLPVLDRAPLFQLAGTPPPVMVPPREARPSPVPSGDVDEPSQVFERARSRFLLHDFDGALELLERIPPHHPVHEQAKDVLAETRARLDGIYTSKIGRFDAVPRVLLSGEQLIWLNLNHRAGFILSQIDGTVTYEDLISLSGMPRLDTLRILCTLLQEGVIGTD